MTPDLPPEGRLPLPSSEQGELERLLESSAPELSRKLSVHERHALGKLLAEYSQIRHISVESHRAGPIPPPRDLAHYAQIIPNGAERIMAMAEQQQTHRIQTEQRFVEGEIAQVRTGQRAGFIIGLSGIVASVILALAGHEAPSMALGGGTLVALVAVFVTGRTLDSKKE